MYEFSETRRQSVYPAESAREATDDESARISPAVSLPDGTHAADAIKIATPLDFDVQNQKTGVRKISFVEHLA